MSKRMITYVLALMMLASALFGAVATVHAAPTDTAVSLCDLDVTNGDF